ncbi:MAG: hypothetical protein GC180_12645 [Bacteroidetes bacterium]|nr:hypothetical protein [Bacteroidota bacterium]
MKTILLLCILNFSILATGQELQITNYIETVKKQDLSDLWTLAQFQVEDDTVTVERAEPLGYIGDNYQRFYIHFISVIQNPKNKLEYFVYGKTKVKDNICSFQGTLIIENAQTYIGPEFPTLKQGLVKGQYHFYEDPDQSGTGSLNGWFQSDFYIDEQGRLKYNALMFIADGFKNNQFEGSWTSYKSGVSKKCNWGDYRIPDSNELDYGAGEFGPNDKYDNFGWRTYRLSWENPTNQPEVAKARQIEQEKWWLNKLK